MPDKLNGLFIDDVRREVRLYLDYLDSIYQIEFKSTADLGLKHLEDRYLEIDFVILDIQMPKPKDFTLSDLDSEKETGFWLLQRSRELLEENKIPVMILTNCKSKFIEETLAQDFAFNPPNLVRVREKNRISAKDFPKEIAAMLMEFGK